MNVEDSATIAKCLSHPLRIGLLQEFRDRKDLSPVEYAREFSELLGNVSYHMNALLDAGVIAQVSTTQRRGALEHRYALRGRRGETALALLDLLSDA